MSSGTFQRSIDKYNKTTTFTTLSGQRIKIALAECFGRILVVDDEKKIVVTPAGLHIPAIIKLLETYIFGDGFQEVIVVDKCTPRGMNYVFEGYTTIPLQDLEEDDVLCPVVIYTFDDSEYEVTHLALIRDHRPFIDLDAIRSEISRTDTVDDVITNIREGCMEHPNFIKYVADAKFTLPLVVECLRSSYSDEDKLKLIEFCANIRNG